MVRNPKEAMQLMVGNIYIYIYKGRLMNILNLQNFVVCTFPPPPKKKKKKTDR